MYHQKLLKVMKMNLPSEVSVITVHINSMLTDNRCLQMILSVIFENNE